MSTPEAFYREVIDLNRYSNSVAGKYARAYNDIIARAAERLVDIEFRQQGVINAVAPETRKRLRAIIKQSKDSLNTWSGESARAFKKELQGLAVLQTEFIEDELKKVVASGNIPINSVAVSKDFGDAVVNTDPTKLNLFGRPEEEFKKFKAGDFALTTRRGELLTLPNGETVEKAFRGIAARSSERLGGAIRQGVLSGETNVQIARRLMGRLNFNEYAKEGTRAFALAGNQPLKLANNQIKTIVRTSINQVSNAASQSVYAANKDVAPEYEYVATLDSRTSSICQRLDGQKFGYDKGPTPPQHFNCRSTTVPVVDYEGLGLTPPPETKITTRPSETGRVPQKVSYGDWLYEQRARGANDKLLKYEPGELQIKTLGFEKAKYFNRLAAKSNGKDALRQVIRSDGTELTLEQLKKKYGKPIDIKAAKKATPKAKPKVKAPVVAAFVSSKPLKKLNVKETIKSYEDYKKHQIKMSEIQYGKDYDHWTGNTDARLERLRQGLDLNSKDWPTDLDYLYWRQGFTKKPVRVKNVKELKARKDLYQGADGENLLVYRGVSNDKWSDQFKGKGNQGDLYFAGEGIYGNGSYAASRSIHSTKATLTKGNENALTLAKNYTEPYGSKITDAQKEIRTTVFGIKKGANIKTWKKGVSTKKLNPKEPHAFPDSDWYEKEFKQWQKDIKKEAEELTGLTYDSTGEAATALGIDAYQIPLPLIDEAKEAGQYIHYNLDYWVILNRNAIVVSDTVGL